MIQSTTDLIDGWQAECAILEQKIVSFRNGRSGTYLTSIQREAAIQQLVETAAEFNVLMDEFSPFGGFPITFHSSDPNAPEPIVSRRCSVDRQAPAEPAYT
jgi:hypothetical protein